MSHVVTFSTEVSGLLCDQLLEWAKRSCASYITNGAAYGHYEFYFDNRCDAANFFEHGRALGLSMQIIEHFG